MALADFKNSIVTKDQFSQTFNKFDRMVQSSARGLDKLGGMLSSGLGGTVAGLAGAAGVAAIGKMAFELGNLGAQSLTTKGSFESLMKSVGLSVGLLDQLKAASGGTITELVLMQQANTALAGASGQLATEMGAALPKLLEAAKAAARLNPAYGDAEFMFQSLVGGIKRGTPLLIDNTGIVLKVGEATEKYAASIGKSADELTSQERSLAILRGTLEGADRLIEQTSGNMNKMAASAGKAKTAWMELKTALGEKLAPATSAAQEAMAGTLNQITSVINSTEFSRAKAQLDSWQAILDDLASVPVDRGLFLSGGRAFQSQEEKTDMMAEATQAVVRYRREIGAMLQEENAAAIVTQQAAHKTREYGSTATIAAAQIGTLTFSLRQAKEAAQGLGFAMGGLSTEYKSGLNTAFNQIFGMGSAIPASEATAIYGDYTRQYAQLELDRSRITRQEYARRKADLDNALSDNLASYRKFGADVGGVASTISDDLKSRIGSALTPTFDLSGLTGGLLGGISGDSFDEAYKRLAAVALRPEELQIHAGDWGDTFAKAGLTGLSPEEAQQRARELVEAYSKGLDFSLIDRDAIKDSVRQAIKADELYNSIVDEIYAEMGKEKPKLAQAGTNIGKQLNKAMTNEVTTGAREYVGAWVNLLVPEIITEIGNRNRRAGGSAS